MEIHKENKHVETDPIVYTCIKAPAGSFIEEQEHKILDMNKDTMVIYIKVVEDGADILKIVTECPIVHSNITKRIFPSFHQKTIPQYGCRGHGTGTNYIKR